MPLKQPAHALEDLLALAGYDRPTFTWSSVTGAATYSLYVKDNTANQVVVNTFNVGAVTSYQLTQAQALTPGHSFTLYIGATSTNGAITWDLTTPQTFSLA